MEIPLRWVVFLLVPLWAVHADEPERRWVEALAADGFADREKAEAALADWAEKHREEAEDFFWRLSQEAIDPEVRLRGQRLLRTHALWERDQQASGFIGIRMRGEIVDPPDEPARPAIRVTELTPNSPAVEAGLRPGDLVVAFEGRALEGQPAKPLEAPEGTVEGNLAEWVRSHRPGKRVVLTVLRDGEELEVPVVLGLYRPAIHSGFAIDEHTYREALRREDDEYFSAWLQRKRSEKD